MALWISSSLNRKSSESNQSLGVDAPNSIDGDSIRTVEWVRAGADDRFSRPIAILPRHQDLNRSGSEAVQMQERACRTAVDACVRTEVAQRTHQLHLPRDRRADESERSRTHAFDEPLVCPVATHLAGDPEGFGLLGGEHPVAIGGDSRKVDEASIHPRIVARGSHRVEWSRVAGSDVGAAGAELGADRLGDVEGEDLRTSLVEVEAIAGTNVFHLIVAGVLHHLCISAVDAAEP